MEKGELARLRMHSQRIVGSGLVEPLDLVTWMGAIQAQDYEMAKWAIALRLLEGRRGAVEAAIDRAQILRTHVLRPTWHLVAAADLRWILDLSAPRLKASLAGRQRQLGLTAPLLSRSYAVIERSLAASGQLSRDELIEALGEAGIPTEGGRASHIFVMAELEGLVCSGSNGGRLTRYALLDERVPAAPKLDRDEALSRLARRYLASRGPATSEDFAWWSGLGLREARRGLSSLGSELEELEVEGRSYLALPSDQPKTEANRELRLLPAFDEYLIAYTDREAAIAREEQRKAISENGIFRPIIIVDGLVVGLWKRVAGKAGASIESELFIRPTKPVTRALNEEIEKYRRYYQAASGRGV